MISQYEAGRNGVGVANLRKLAQALECQSEDIDERYATGEIRSRSGDNFNRWIRDESLRYLVDIWQEIPLEARIEMLNGAVAAKKQARRPTVAPRN
jgi:hypothetical protein